jgi:bile acid:Na+ symporter, BASS family
MQISLPFQEIYVSLLSVATLLGMGLGLTLEQISDTIRHHWRKLLWGVIFNFVVIPVAALGTRNAVNLDPAFFTGFFLCMAAPGGGTGSLLTYCAKGDISFSIALMFPLTLVSLVVTPLWMVFAVPANNGANPWLAVIPMVTALGVYMVTPLVLGLAIRKQWPSIALSLVKPVTRLSMVMLLMLVVGYLVSKGNQIAAGGLTLIILSLASACAALAGGMTTTPHAGLRRALGFTSSIRNVTLAILLAGTSYPDPRTMLAVLSYGLAQYVVSFPAAFIAVRLAGNQPLPFPLPHGGDQ